MAYWEVDWMDTSEVLRRWQAGESQRQFSSSLNRPRRRKRRWEGHQEVAPKDPQASERAVAECGSPGLSPTATWPPFPGLGQGLPGPRSWGPPRSAARGTF